MKKQKVFLKITSALALIAMMVAATDSPAGPITILWEDTFEGTDPITVEGGTGTGYTQFEFLEGIATGAAQLAAVVEANGVLTMPIDSLAAEDAGNNHHWFATDATFAINGAPTTLTVTLTEAERTQSTTGQTGRFFYGFTRNPLSPAWLADDGKDFLDSSVDGEYLEGLWVMIHGRVNYADIASSFTLASQGALIHIHGTPFFPDTIITVLETFEWDTSVFVFGDPNNAGGRFDRVSMDMIASDLTFELTSDVDGYELGFSSTDGSAVMPATMTGTWAAKGVINDFSDVKALTYTRGRFIQSAIDLFKVTQGDGGGVPSVETSGVEAWSLYE